MSRLVRISIFAVLLLGVWAVAAQGVTPVTAPRVQQIATLPPAASPTPDLTLLAPSPTPEQSSGAATPAALGVEQTEALPILINDRNDLELLATAAIGNGQRPLGWSGSADVTDPQLPLLIRLDLELLAGAVMGADKRPPGWFGVVPSVPIAVARDIRHDLELLADVVVGTSGIRPAGWKGDDPIMRCDRATQALITLLKHEGIGVQIDFTQPDYCDAAQRAASLYVERQVLQPPVVAAANVPGNQARFPFQADNPFVVAFLDRKALHKIGVLPVGTGFQPVARSYVDFSNMMLVRGDNFEVFVDYTTTQISAEEFLALPDVGAGILTDCTAYWCGQGLN